ncbi:helix-turn-helix domain-containing protein [Endozoicomonas sp. GU-1]|uniref:helix-turn-helix domain-containing protein n=2 Tax=Endozoicomonas sp. GU-1 TaxID=3009078 RepID=UPI0022B5E0E2|nr:helix-turn-helix domain-containing protein [Endozoicomonas sp. GU-1]WBA84323.1 helix-turn-helix domain-containing protein [Endozoicomonas sp. GU-1]
MIRVKINTSGMDKLNMTQKFLLVVLATFANSEGECWPSQGLLAELLGVTTGTICTSLKKLEEEKFIESFQRKTKHGGTNTKLYRMLFEPFVFKQVKEQHYNCFGQRVDDPRMSDTTWADGLD